MLVVGERVKKEEKFLFFFEREFFWNGARRRRVVGSDELDQMTILRRLREVTRCKILISQ